MAEEIERGIIEAEIADLTREIEERKKALESSGEVLTGAADGRELIRAALAAKAVPAVPQATPAVSSATSSKPASYLDSLDDETIQKVNTLVEYAFSNGIAKSFLRASEEVPSVADAFHDALADKLYDELKLRGVIK